MLSLVLKSGNIRKMVILWGSDGLTLLLALWWDWTQSFLTFFTQGQGVESSTRWHSCAGVQAPSRAGDHSTAQPWSGGRSCCGASGLCSACSSTALLLCLLLLLLLLSALLQSLSKSGFLCFQDHKRDILDFISLFSEFAREEQRRIFSFPFISHHNF